MSIERELLIKIKEDMKGLKFTPDFIDEINRLLAQPEQPEQEPVAWIIQTEVEGKLLEWVCTDKKHYMEEHDSIKEPIPLYLAPPKREPLSDEEVIAKYRDIALELDNPLYVPSYYAGFRDAEKAHGIGVDDE